MHVIYVRIYCIEVIPSEDIRVEVVVFMLARLEMARNPKSRKNANADLQ